MIAALPSGIVKFFKRFAALLHACLGWDFVRVFGAHGADAGEKRARGGGLCGGQSLLLASLLALLEQVEHAGAGGKGVCLKGLHVCAIN